MIEKLVTAVVLAFAVALLGLMAVQWRDCTADDKAFVRGVVWFECVAR